MIQQYSKVNPSKLLYSIIRFDEISDYRLDASPDSEYLQLSAISLKAGTTIPPHKHLPIQRVTDITQEAWIVVKGKIEGTFYDLDDKVLEVVTLTDGDCVILFRGGHKLLALEENTIFYELKTGPYYGKTADKKPIN